MNKGIEDMNLANVPHEDKVLNKEENLNKSQNEEIIVKIDNPLFTLADIEIKREKIIKLIEEENNSNGNNYNLQQISEPLTKEVNAKNFEENDESNKLAEKLYQAKKNKPREAEPKKPKISQKIMKRVQDLEKHMNGESFETFENKEEAVDDYMNIILEKPVVSKNKKLKKKLFTEFKQ